MLTSPYVQIAVLVTCNDHIGLGAKNSRVVLVSSAFDILGEFDSPSIPELLSHLLCLEIRIDIASIHHSDFPLIGAYQQSAVIF